MLRNIRRTEKRAQEHTGLPITCDWIQPFGKGRRRYWGVSISWTSADVEMIYPKILTPGQCYSYLLGFMACWDAMEKRKEKW